MKKLLLLSLLVLGAKSFAAVHATGTANDVQMPLVVKGTVVDKAGTELIIESDTVGMEGNAMSFVFDTVVKGGKAGAQGTFTLRRGDKSALASSGMGSSSNQLQIGFGDSFKQKDTSASVGDATVAVNYVLSGNLEENAYNGVVKVEVDATSASAGTFEDRTKAIHAKVS